MHYSECFSSNYMYFLGYETHEKLISSSGEGSVNTNTTSKQGIPKSNINTTCPSETLAFFVPPINTHVRSCQKF